MNGHFSVVNKRGLTTTGIMILFSIILFSLSLAKRISSGSMLWTIPVVIAIIIFILTLMLLVGVITAGVDVKKNKVIFADPSGQGGKKVQFDLGELKSVELHNADGLITNPETANLAGARIIFTLRNGKTCMYYPIQITYKQFDNIKIGLTEMAKKSKKFKDEPKKPMTKAEKKAAVNAKSIKRIKEEEK